MRRVITCAVAAAVLLVSLLGTGTPAQAGKSTDIALGLASFAVFNQVVGPFLRPHETYHRHVVYETVVTQPAVVYQTPPPVYVAAAPVPVVTQPTVIQYPHGRYELQWLGSQYVWVWIPAVPPPPPPPAP